MAGTFSVGQYYSTPTNSGTYSMLGATGSLWNFKQATTPGTSDYNTAGSNIPAGQNSFGMQFRPWWTVGAGATNTFSNIRFYMSTTWTSAAMTAVGTSATGYTQSTASSTVATDGGASNASISTGSATNQAIMLGTLTVGNGSGFGPTYLRVQMTTATNAAAGDSAYAGFTWVYDES